MELTKNIIEDSLKEALNIFKENNIGEVTNEVDIDYVESDYFLSTAKENTLNDMLVKAGAIKNFDKEYPVFLVVYNNNKSPIRKMLGLPYLISIDFNRAKMLLRPYNKKQVQKYFVSVFLHEITHVFEDSVIAKHKAFYDKTLLDNFNNVDAANEILAETVSYKYGFKNVSDKINNELWATIYNRIMTKFNQNPFQNNFNFKSNLELF